VDALGRRQVVHDTEKFERTNADAKFFCGLSARSLFCPFS
jgi:hypothetical protein